MVVLPYGSRRTKVRAVEEVRVLGRLGYNKI